MINQDIKNFDRIMNIVEQNDIKMPLLAINEPIFGVVSYLDKIYTIYVMQDRTLLKDNHLVDIKEILITEPNLSNLYKVIDGEISIYNFFLESNNYSIGKIANKIFPKVEIKDFSKILNKIPSQDLHLNLNDYCTQYYKNNIKSRYKRLKEYNNFNNSLTFTNNKNVEVKKQIEALNIHWELKDEIYSNRERL